MSQPLSPAMEQLVRLEVGLQDAQLHRIIAAAVAEAVQAKDAEISRLTASNAALMRHLRSLEERLTGKVVRTPIPAQESSR